MGVFAPPLLQQRSDTPCPMLTSSSCFNQGSFADPLTEVLRNGARALLAQAIEAEVAEFLAKHVDLKTATGLSRGPAPKLRGCRSGVNESGSQETRRWRETDSNPRSPVEESPFVETVLSRFLPPLRFRGGQSVLTNCLQGRGDRSISATHATRGRHVERPVKSAYVREVQGPG